jgi:hypothetical protein
MPTTTNPRKPATAAFFLSFSHFSLFLNLPV